MFLVASAIATTMNLVCPGVWTTPASDSVFVKDKWVFVDSTRASDGDVRVELTGTTGRLVKVDGTKSKSYPLTDVHLGGGGIQAKMRLDFLDKAHVIIDPSTGRIRISGWGFSFLGVCQKGAAGDPL